MGMAAVMGGVQGGIDAYVYNHLVGPRPMGSLVQLISGGEVKLVRIAMNGHFLIGTSRMFTTILLISQNPPSFDGSCFDMTLSSFYD